jgi:dihydropteroate synthase
MKNSNTAIMGILNITPDSFYKGSRYSNIESAIDKAKLMISQGVNIIDIGGESTRPGSLKINVDDELNRVIPVIKSLNDSCNIDISIDTSKPEVMEKAVCAGATIINDIYALQNNHSLEVASSLKVKICLMHMQGNPKDMQKNPTYTNVIDSIKKFFTERIEACIKKGINEDKIIIDPGFGFGKTLAHNLLILKQLAEFKKFNMPILVGISRKSMIGKLLNNRDVDDRMVGSVVAGVLAVQNGANIIRTHDVLATKDALTILQTLN